DRHHDLVGARCIVEPNFHAVKVAADVGCVFVSKRNVEDHTEASALLGRWNQGCAFAKHFAHGCAELRVKNGGGMFDFAVFANSGCFAVTFGFRAVNTERDHRPLSQQLTKFFANHGQLRKIINESSSAGVFNHGHGGGAAGGWIDLPAHLGAGFF